MTTSGRGRGRILGSLGSAEGKGIVRMQDRLENHIDDVWSALTDPSRLANWYGEVEGNLRLGGEYRVHLFASGWEGTGVLKRASPRSGCWCESRPWTSRTRIKSRPR